MTGTTSALDLVSRPKQTQEEDLIKQVKDLFLTDADFVLQVSNYHQLCEQEKRRMCSTFLPITLCKVPARDGNGVLFFLSKEAAL